MKRERLWSVMVGLQTHGLETKCTVPMTVIASDEQEANERAKQFCADVRASGDRLTLSKSRPIDPADYLLNHLPAGSGAAMSVEHEPTPYTFEKSDEQCAYVYNDGPVCSVWVNEDFPGDVGRARATATAEFIVRACNAHYDLLAAIGKLLCPMCKNPIDQTCRCMAAAGAHKAIAKAKGGAS